MAEIPERCPHNHGWLECQVCSQEDAVELDKELRAIDQLSAELSAANMCIKRLEQALQRYGKHSKTCEAANCMCLECQCDCGFQAALHVTDKAAKNG